MTLLLSFFLGGVACLAYEPIKSKGLIGSYICILVAKFFNSCTFDVLYLYTSELFPTVFRGTVFGLVSFCARIGGALAPPVDGLLRNEFMYIFGVLSVICGMCMILMRETKGTAMADSASDGVMKGTGLKLNSSGVHSQNLA